MVGILARREISEAIAAENKAALLEAIVRAEGINASVKYARKVRSIDDIL